MKLLRKNLLAIFLSMCAVVAWAAPGDLDTSFGGGDGWVSAGFAPVTGNDNAGALVQQSDGKLVVAGSIHDSNAFSLMRYNIDGSLDASFGSGGRVEVGSAVFPHSVLQQTDGKLVVVGYASASSMIQRYQPDGVLDTTFGTNGTVLVGGLTSYAAILQADGNLVIAGSNSGNFALARYNTNGLADISFGETGSVNTAVGINTSYAYALIQQADGKLVAVGDSYGAIAAVRYNTDGSLDSGFGSGGKVTTSIGSYQSASDVIQQPDGKLVLAGSGRTATTVDFALVRYNTNGSLDVSFDGDGVAITALGTSGDQAKSLVMQTDGKLVAVGLSQQGADYAASLARYNTDGSLDPTFGSGGKVISVIGNSGWASSVIQQADGRLVTAGWSRTASNDDWTVVRYNSNGTPDTAFDADGIVITDFAYTVGSARTVIYQSDGKLVAAGTGSKTFAIVRYNPDGDLDSSFGGGGQVITALGSGSNASITSIIQQADGKLVAAGYSSIGRVLVRYNSNGSLDNSFSSDGIVTTSLDGITSVIEQSDGKIVVAGYKLLVSRDFALQRYNSDGSLDTSFDGDGTVTTHFSNFWDGMFWSYSQDEVASLIQQSDGKLVAAGFSFSDGGSYTDIALARYNSDGSLDASFDSDGMLTTAIGATHDYAYSIIQQVDGRLVVTGTTGAGQASSNNDIVLVRYNSNGSLDSSFDGDGKVTTAIGTGADVANSVIQQMDGKLVVAGFSHNGSNNDIALVRYNSNGSLDSSFDGDGKLTTAVGSGADVANSLIQQMDGKLVVVGEFGLANVTQFLVLRYYGESLIDSDGDAVPDNIDNCPNDSNADQLNTDGVIDGGDACDTDDDNDSVLDINDAFPLNASEWLDTDGDTIGNNADTDDDNDGALDVNDKFPLDSTKSRFVRHDTEIDGDSDILTRSSSTGTWTRYTIQNAAITGSGAINAYTSSSVQYVAQLDANGDGDADILTRNTSTGAWYLHQVQSGAVTSTAPIYLYANLDQQFIGLGDFNNDGVDDVMLRSASAGYYTVFLLSNHAVSSTVYYNAWASSSSVPQGIGDFNGDGTDDLLVRRTSDNLYFIFKTTNGAVAASYCACNIWNNPDWTFQFAGDTNKDGIDDIVIRGTGASADGFWWNFRMNNFSSTQTTNLNTFKDKALVSYAASGDYNGDGYTDMLIRVNNGPVYVAKIVNGLVSGSTTLLSNLPSDHAVLK